MEVAAAFAVLLAAAVWAFFRRQRHYRGGGPLADVPDAPPTAVPSAAPGLTLPYSSVDPFAPPKPGTNQTGVDGPPGPP